MSKQTTMHIPDGVDHVIEGLIKQSGATAEVPVLTQADVCRLLLRDACDRLIEGDLMVESETAEITGIDGETLSELIPKHKRARFLYEERKDEGWYPDMIHGFEGRVRDRLEKRFKNGYSPEGAREVAQNYIGEAHDWWVKIEDDRETFEEKKQFVLDRIADYRRKYETTTYDPNDEFLEGFSGVEDGHAEAEIDDIREEIRAIAERKYEESKPSVSDVSRAISMVYDVDEDAVTEIVDEVRRESTIEDQARASDLDQSRTPALTDDGTAHDAEAKSPDYNREEPEDSTVVEVDDEDAEWLVEATDGGQDVDDDDREPITDGGRSKSPGQEGYWTELSEQADEDVPPTVRDRIVDQLDHEEIHGITGSVRRGETYYCIVSYTSSRPSGDVINLRTVVVDIEAGTVKISDNGIWYPAEHEIAHNLGQILSQTSTVMEHDLDAAPMVRDSPDVETSALLDQEMISDEYRRPDSWGESWGNGEGPPPAVWDLVDRLDEAGLPTDRFSRLDFGAKTPFERYGNRDAGDLLGNYGVETGLPADAPADEMDERVLRGDELVIVDVDYPEEAPLDELPETYAVSSANGPDERAHHYYRVPDKSAVAEALDGWTAKPGWGDVWLAGEYVVGPGCYDDESGGRYEVVEDIPISTVEADEMIELISSEDSDQDVEDEPAAPDRDADPEPEPVEDDVEDDPDQEDSETETAEVVCHDCGSSISRDDAGMDLVDGETVWICAGGCDDVQDGEPVTDGGLPADHPADDPPRPHDDALPAEYDPAYQPDRDDRVRTRGIESAVYSDEEEEIGHVVMLDYDDVGRETVIREAEEIEGPTVVVESSPGSWHLYGLAVRSWEEVVDIARSSGASESYVDEMVRRGEFTLRIDAKGSTPAPTVDGIDCSVVEADEISEPHLSALRQRADEELDLVLRALQAGIGHDYRPVGSLLRRSTYETDGSE